MLCSCLYIQIIFSDVIVVRDSSHPQFSLCSIDFRVINTCNQPLKVLNFAPDVSKGNGFQAFSEIVHSNLKYMVKLLYFHKGIISVPNCLLIPFNNHS